MPPPCTDPGVPDGGVRYDNSFNHNDRAVRFACKSGWTMQGAGMIWCNKGVWNKPAPKCMGVGPLQCPVSKHCMACRWAILFSHPADYTPVCTTELGRVALLADEFKKRGVKMAALSCDDVESHKGWIKDVKDYSNIKGDFPYPIIADPKRDLAVLLGMVDPDEKDAKGLPLTCRAVFIIGPDKKLKLSILYPATTGRNFDEVLRVIDSLQLTATKKVATPVDWKLFPGNTDATSMVKHRLEKPFIARKIRFLPFAKTGYLITRACMRVEVYGCDLPKDCVMVGSRVLGKWYASYRGADIYFKAYVKTISEYDVQVEIESEDHNDDYYKTISKKSLVLDIPPKREELRIGTRVLAPWYSKYYAGKITNTDRHYYLVRADDGDTKWLTIDKIRRLKVEQFCE
ncbi:hypothetical protein QZH41_005005 [Actinostola sp. cb2023]|nr:hypothetical protein QZH41_005005 [Actinostola sp. cb2023]